VIEVKRFLPVTCIAMICLAGTPVRAAQPITIDFEDIFNKPMGRDQLPPFTWKGVLFSGGGLHRGDAFGTVYWAVNKNQLQMKFPNGSTDISFDVDGLGTSLVLFEYMPLQVWQGEIGDTLIATLPIPPDFVVVPPKNKITIPGPASLVTIFTAWPPSGISEYGNSVVLDNVRYTPPDPEPAITFDAVLPQHARVLAQNHGNDPYPSPLQTKDREIRVEATVRLNGQPAAGRTIHFRVTDPPDPATYVVNAGTNTQNDNFDGPGSLNGGGPTTTGVSDASGRVAVTLRVTSFAAGDNYEIEASPNASFTCGQSCARSAEYTSWKRVYIEVDRMFRKGAYITADAKAGQDFVYVSDLSMFHSGDVVRLIHAPRLQVSPGIQPSPLAIAEFFYAEDHVVDVVTTTTVLADGTILNPRLQLRAGDALSAAFGVDPSFTGPNSSAPIPYLRDAAGVVAAGFYEPHMSLLAGAYENMYVEIVPVPNAVTELPFEPSVPTTMAGHFGNKWFENGKRTSSAVIPDSNHVHVIGGTRHDSPQTSPTVGAELGQTAVGNGHHRSWVWVQRIEQAVTQPLQNVFLLSAAEVNAEVTLHETVHEWGVNPVPPPNVQVGHCLRERYQTDGRFCHMHAPFYNLLHNPELGDGQADFHYEVDANGNVDSEYTHIRRHGEPFVK
jgi:hypothetical protein